MKLLFEKDCNRTQPDPFMFETGGKYYLYVTAGRGVEVYTADTPFSEWHYFGIVCSVDGCKDYWAPCIIELEGWFYLYYSCSNAEMFEHLHVSRSRSPLGPFSETKRLFNRFTIDAHVVRTAAGLFLFYAEDDRRPARIGTRIFADRLIDPYTPENRHVEVVAPTFDEEIFKRDRFGDGKDWHTIEGPFWLEADGWQYLMYSGACYENETYHIGYAVAHSREADLINVHFEKHTANGRFDPLMIKNDFEEGVGHHSVIRYNGAYYAVYHGRDLINGAGERRTARICRLHLQNGVITAERYADKL